MNFGESYTVALKNEVISAAVLLVVLLSIAFAGTTMMTWAPVGSIWAIIRRVLAWSDVANT